MLAGGWDRPRPIGNAFHSVTVEDLDTVAAEVRLQIANFPQPHDRRVVKKRRWSLRRIWFFPLTRRNGHWKQRRRRNRL